MGQGAASILNTFQCYKSENTANQTQFNKEQKDIEMDFSLALSMPSEVSQATTNSEDQTLVSVIRDDEAIQQLLDHEDQQPQISDNTTQIETQQQFVGEFIGDKGQKYEGEWKDNKLHGVGKLTYPNGSYYEGDFKDGAKHGHGCFVWDDSPVGNQQKGSGQVSFRSRSPLTLFQQNYDSDHFKEYYRHFTGEWKNDQMHGDGYLVYQDGRNYTGHFKRNKLHGHGICIWPNGKKYEGSWQYGKQNGEGILTNSKGQVKKGLWISGKFTKSVQKSESVIIQTPRYGNLPSSELEKLRMSLFTGNKNE